VKILCNILLISLFLANPINSLEIFGLPQPHPRPHSQNSSANRIVLNVTVTDQFERIVAGLEKTAFTLYDNNVPQEITFFAKEDIPLSVGIIYDMSVSMSHPRKDERIVREVIKAGLAQFMQSSNPANEYFLMGFAKEQELLSDWTSESSIILSKITESALKRRQTALYDACYAGVEKLTGERHQKRVILLISDGQDNASRHKGSELRELLKKSDVLVYALGLVVYNEPGSSLGMAGLNTLDEMVSGLGGKLYVPKTSTDLNRVFEQIALELAHQYRIGYRSSNDTHDGKWHRIKIEVRSHPINSGKVPRLIVRSREGYYAK
jgi:Ca-activated chloride channel family protein